MKLKPCTKLSYAYNFVDNFSFALEILLCIRKIKINLNAFHKLPSREQVILTKNQQKTIYCNDSVKILRNSFQILFNIIPPTSFLDYDFHQTVVNTAVQRVYTIFLKSEFYK